MEENLSPNKLPVGEIKSGSDNEIENLPVETESKINVLKLVAEDCKDIMDEFEYATENLGRIKRTLNGEKCPECGACLQVRIIQEQAIEEGEEYLKDVEYICCKDLCGYTREIEQKRKRKKNREVKEDDFDERSKKRSRTPGSNARDLRKGDRKRFF